MLAFFSTVTNDINAETRAWNHVPAFYIPVIKRLKDYIISILHQ